MILIVHLMNSNQIVMKNLWSNINIKVPLSFENSKYVKEWNLYEKFVVQYSGNMGLWHDINTFIMAAKELEKSRHIQFVFIGDGIRKKNAKKLADDLEVKNISHLNEIITALRLSPFVESVEREKV